MNMQPMERSAFNERYNYRLVLASDNIDLKHCRNCRHLGEIGCLLMIQCGMPREEIKVLRRRGLCDLWQRAKPIPTGTGENTDD